MPLKEILFVTPICSVIVDEGEPTAKVKCEGDYCASTATVGDAQPTYEANGQILATLFAGFQQLLQNPAVQALIASLLSTLLKPAPGPAATT